MKLDLKEWIAKVSTTETQTITAVGKVWKFTRIGNVVYVDASSDSNASISGGLTLLGTLNASMRPQYNVYLKCTNWNDDVRLMIDPNGAVNLYIPYSISGTHNLGFSGYSFIVGGGST